MHVVKNSLKKIEFKKLGKHKLKILRKVRFKESLKKKTITKKDANSVINMQI